MQHVARFKISLDMLREMLVLPPGTEIVNAALRYDDATVEVTVRHPDLQPVPDHADVPLCTPMFRRHEPVTFEGWGQADA